MNVNFMHLCEKSWDIYMNPQPWARGWLPHIPTTYYLYAQVSRPVS